MQRYYYDYVERTIYINAAEKLCSPFTKSRERIEILLKVKCLKVNLLCWLIYCLLSKRRSGLKSPALKSMVYTDFLNCLGLATLFAP